MLIRAKAPRNFKISKVPGHAIRDELSEPDDVFKAIGSDFADQTAKGAARQTPSPTEAQML